MLLVCVRHLPTEWNRRGLLQGRRDTELIEPDETTLQAIGRDRERLERLGPFDLVLTSRLQRARRTAEIYGFPNYTADALLDEFDFGEWEGHQRSEMMVVVGTQWEKDPRKLVLGESLVELESRIRMATMKYAVYDRVLAFGHGSWMRALRSIVECGDVRRMNRKWIENGEVLACECDGEGQITGASQGLV